METTTNDIMEELKKIRIDVNIIKEKLDDGGELTDWAKKELAEARARPESENISLEEVKRKILAR